MNRSNLRLYQKREIIFRLGGFAILALVLLTACNFPARGNPPKNLSLRNDSPQIAENTNESVVVLPPGSKVTSTPFLPADPTARAQTPTPVPPATWKNFPGPIVQPDYPIPPPVDRINLPDDQINILLLGSDQRPNTTGFRTDTIVLVSINPETETVSMISFPRDLYVYIPGWTMQRINTAHARGGFEMTQDTFAYNFGIRPDYFALINFWSFVDVIDSLGGIDVDVAVTMTDLHYLYGTYTVPAGRVNMDGDLALWYVRARYATSDFDRTRRQQEVLKATFLRLMSLNAIKRAPELYELYINNVDTNASFSDITPHLGLAARIADNLSNIEVYSVSRSEVTSYRTSTGAAVLLPDYDAVTRLLETALNAP